MGRSQGEMLVAAPLSAAAAGEVAEEFARAGVAVVVQEAPARRGWAELAWLALLAVPLQPFYEELAKNAADDAYRLLKKLAGAVFERVRTPGSPGVLVLQDATTGVEIVLEFDLPDESYEQLVALDLAAYPLGPLHYDRHLRRWRSERDEAARQTGG